MILGNMVFLIENLFNIFDFMDFWGILNIVFEVLGLMLRVVIYLIDDENFGNDINSLIINDGYILMVSKWF